MARLDAASELSRAITRLLLAEPFLGRLLAGIPRQLDESVPTAGVAVRRGGSVVLVVNPTFFTKQIRRIDERVGLVKHEVLHLLLRHLFRVEDRDPLLWNIACDVVVNALVKPWPLPEGSITRASFPDLTFPRDPSADEVYALLRREAPDDREALDQLFDESPSHHGGWSADVAETQQIADAALERMVRQARARCGGGWGELPGSLASGVEAWLSGRTPSIDWRRVLRMFAGMANRTRIEDTLKRPSRRFGTLPGHRVRARTALLVAIDSSGSISDETLARFFAEVHGIWRTGAEVTVVVCDLEIQAVSIYRGRPPEQVFGRGGTAFEPVFAWSRAQWPRRFDGLVYLTDGRGPPPTTKPGCPVLWVIEEGGDGDGLPGRQVRLT